ncbi:receptor-like protein kinase ANXUR2 [Rutidosis leptorrhynchoides]|uniref:receptor-like protein kinase ANXUR2 n=1 Tax=Rutidosis leptorrhynchoides TaxID=125765 RepID=UPI003A99C98D
MEDHKSVIIFDLTTFSIALDEHFGAKIVDFGFSMFLPQKYPEACKLARESNVYTLGVIMFEMLCGRLASDDMYTKESEAGLVDVARKCFLNGTLMEIIDPSMRDENNLVITKGPNQDSIKAFVDIAYLCVAETQDKRPTMEVVVIELEKALSFQELLKS